MFQLGQFLQNLRKSCFPSETAASIADMLGVKRDYLSRVESGTIHTPPPDLVTQMMKLYEVPLEVSRQVVLLASKEQHHLAYALRTCPQYPCQYLATSGILALLTMRKPIDQVAFSRTALFDFLLKSPADIDLDKFYTACSEGPPYFFLHKNETPQANVVVVADLVAVYNYDTYPAMTADAKHITEVKKHFREADKASLSVEQARAATERAMMSLLNIGDGG